MMILFITLSIVFILWMIYAGWSAPVMRQDVDGRWITIQKEKNFSDLFKRSKKNSGSYSDLEKYRRGRSKH